VAFTYRSNADDAQALVEEISSMGQRSLALHADLNDVAQASRAVSDAVQEFGGIHTLVHAAGPLVAQQYLSTVTPEQYRDALLGEAAAFFNIVQPALTNLRASNGSLVAVTTAATKRFPARDGLSSGAKGAIEQVVAALAVEEGRYGVRANCVGPGMLSDGMAARLIASGELDDQALDAARANIPLNRFGTAEDIAELVCFLASNRAAFISGQHISVDGGYSA
jgi:NAD(P)-dependent dehydrogenase (short-subunit alcohol dehydrogenase family)